MPQDAAVVAVGSFVALGLAYVIYGRFLARRIFQLDDSRPTPAHTMEDGLDYLPTKVPVLFGHHFASIAGLGPILGPAIAVIWGWVPAVIWVVLGSIFIGAVHDLGALTVSLGYKGRSIGDVSQSLIGPRARLLFLLIIYFLLSLAMGVFVKAISSLFVFFFPSAIIPSLGLMLVAMVMGVAVYKLRMPLGLMTAIGLLAFGGLIVLGVRYPVPSYQWFATSDTRQILQQAREEAADGFPAPYGSDAAISYLKAKGRQTAAMDLEGYEIDGEKHKGAAAKAQHWWIYALLIYGFIASVLPVWLLLQPRDYINSFQLYAALGLMLVGLIVASYNHAPASHIEARAFIPREETGAPLIFPFLLVTIACGAISGFHSLVSSGTTVRQLDRQSHALPIGYGSMLTEGALAVLVILACVAGLDAAEWGEGGIYSSWDGMKKGLGARLSAVVEGGGSFLEQVGVSRPFAEAFLAVTITAFALTTLDSATRLLRFNVEELFRSVGLGVLANRYLASLIAVGGIAFFGFSDAGVMLWTLFGTTNQLLASLTLLTVSLFLYKLGRNMAYTLVPMLLMFVVSLGAMGYSLYSLSSSFGDNWQLIVVTIIVLAMAIWLIVEAVLSFRRGRGGLDFGDDELGYEAPQGDQKAAVSAELN